MSTYILVHGGSHGAWFWDPTVADLRERGHQARAIDMPGRDGTPTVTLDDYVARIGAEVDAVTAETGEKPILVAHSMGGLAVTQFAERHPDDIRSVIYLGAVVPVDGKSGLDTLGEAGADSVLLGEGALVPTPDGGAMVVNPDIAQAAFYGLCDADVAAAAIPRLNPEPIGPMATPLSLGDGFASVRKSWIAGTEDHTVPYALQQAEAAACGAELSTITADHSANYSARAEVAELLVSLG